ncbi:NAD(P)-dependent oxidoreductase [Oceanobacillus sp. CF4.6]|uniref:NAD(P)-dependent oxidoreductase n=1 Tax=Oceanobacillus sp. CF4.6 TaxID=3373080 RepID=UPI003EE60E4C
MSKGRIGFIGVGTMGRHLVHNLIKNDYEVFVYDMKQEALDYVVAFGAKPAESLKQLMEASQTVFVAVMTDDQVKSVIAGEDGLLEYATPEKLIVINSSINPQTVLSMAELANKKGVNIIDAPMSGGEPGAIEGTLTFMVGSNDKQLFEQIRPILNCIGSSIFYVGPTGSGEAIKLANNLMALCNNLIALESVKLAKGYGITEEQLMEVAGLSTGNSYIVENWDYFGNMMQTHSLAGTKDVYTFLTKDIKLAVESANAIDLSLPIGGLCWQLSDSELEKRDKENRKSGRIYDTPYTAEPV